LKLDKLILLAQCAHSSGNYLTSFLATREVPTTEGSFEDLVKVLEL
jgi:hypothetical protein